MIYSPNSQLQSLGLKYWRVRQNSNGSYRSDEYILIMFVEWKMGGMAKKENELLTYLSVVLFLWVDFRLGTKTNPRSPPPPPNRWRNVIVLEHIHENQLT